MTPESYRETHQKEHHRQFHDDVQQDQTDQAFRAKGDDPESIGRDLRAFLSRSSSLK